MGKPSVILLGSKPGAAVALSIMLRRGWQVRFVVVSTPQNPEWLPTPAVDEIARNAGIPVVLKEGLPSDANADFVISYMYRNLVTADVLEMGRRAAVNFHAAPLPEFGGWAFYNLAILENAAEYGCTCHHMDEGFDTGPLLKVRRFPIDAGQETAASLEAMTQKQMITLFEEFCELAESGAELPKIPQDPQKMRYLKRREFERLKRIPDDADEQSIQRYARAFWYPPYQCAYMNIDGRNIEVLPESVKLDLAKKLHAHDFDELMAASNSR